MEAALEAARWLEAAALPQAAGVAWPEDPRAPERIELGLYGGTTGVLLPILELHQVTGDPRWLALAGSAGDYLLSRLDGPVEPGLYTGLAGIGFALTELATAGGGDAYRQGALRCVDALRASATPAGSGVEWPSERYVPTDIIAGGAGIGLFLLYAARALGADTIGLSLDAGRRLAELGERTRHGLDWAMGLPGWHHMPNFSHGTAGIAYFLATLADVAKESAMLDVAVLGAQHLQGIAVTEGNICAILRNDPPPTTERGPRYQLGWCHGPTGTAALWFRLFEVTGDQRWLEWFERSARTLLPGAMPTDAETYPATDTDGTMAAVNYCHGTSGNAPFLLQAGRLTGQEAFTAHGERLLADCISRGVPAGAGITWQQEAREIDPATGRQQLVAVPTFSNGTAGVAYGLLSAAAVRAGRALSVVRPDDPFGGLPPPDAQEHNGQDGPAEARHR